MSRLNAMADRLAGAAFGLTNYNNLEADVNYYIGVATVASAATLPITTRTTVVTGSVTIANVSDALGAVGGQEARLIFQAALTMQHNGGGTGNIRTRNGVNRSIGAGEVVTLTYDATSSVWREGPRAPGDQLDYAQITASPSAITATTEGTAPTVITGNAVVYDGSQVKVEFFFPGCTSSGVDIGFAILRGATVVGQVKTSSVGTDAAFHGCFYGVAFDTPPAGSATYTLAAYTGSAQSLSLSAGTGGSGNLVPAFLRVTKA